MKNNNILIGGEVLSKERNDLIPGIDYHAGTGGSWDPQVERDRTKFRSTQSPSFLISCSLNFIEQTHSLNGKNAFNYI